MDERVKKAFDFAADLAKQLITLATGLIALTITFSKDFIQHAPGASKVWALLAWCLLLGSVVFGIWTLMALTGNLGKGKDDARTALPDVYTPNVRLPATLQILSFLLALVFTVTFAAMST